MSLCVTFHSPLHPFVCFPALEHLCLICQSLPVYLNLCFPPRLFVEASSWVHCYPVDFLHIHIYFCCLPFCLSHFRIIGLFSLLSLSFWWWTCVPSCSHLDPVFENLTCTSSRKDQYRLSVTRLQTVSFAMFYVVSVFIICGLACRIRREHVARVTTPSLGRCWTNGLILTVKRNSAGL